MMSTAQVTRSEAGSDMVAIKPQTRPRFKRVGRDGRSTYEDGEAWSPVLIVTFALMAALGAPAALHGDFDHDGKPDTAQIVRGASGERQLVIRRGAEAGPVLVRSLGTSAGDVFLEAAKPGHWPTACAKGLGRDDQPCPRKTIDTRGGELMFGTREASLWVVEWNGRTFESVALSD